MSYFIICITTDVLVEDVVADGSVEVGYEVEALVCRIQVQTNHAVWERITAMSLIVAVDDAIIIQIHEAEVTLSLIHI